MREQILLMALTISLILVGISIVLLSIYGADVAVGFSNDDGEGFIPFDHRTRGLGLGLPALILPFVAFFISRSEPSKVLGIMIIIAGVLIIIGGAAVIGNADPDSERNVLTEAGPLIVAGAIQIGLGGYKLRS